MKQFKNSNSNLSLALNTNLKETDSDEPKLTPTTMESDAETSSSSNSAHLNTVDKAILSNFRNILQINQLTGYFPLRINQNNKIESNKCSVPFLWSSVLILIAIFVNIIHRFDCYSGLEESVSGQDPAPAISRGIRLLPHLQLLKSRIDLSQSPQSAPTTLKSTEIFVYEIIICTFGLFTIWFKLNGLLKRRKTLEFWEENCTKLEIFTELETDLNFGADLDPANSDNLMNNVRKRAVKYVRYGLFSAVILFVIPLGHDLYEKIFQNNNGISENEVTTSRGNWLIGLANAVAYIYSMTVLLHFADCIYIVMFIKVYQVCMRLISESLRSIALTQHDREVRLRQLHRKRLEAIVEMDVEDQDHDGDDLTLFNNLVSSTSTAGSMINMERKSSEKVDNCISAYNLIEDLIQDFKEHFKWEIVAEVMFSVSLILLFGYFVFCGFRDGKYCLAIITILPMTVYGFQLYLLRGQASLLEEEAKDVGNMFYVLKLDDFPSHFQTKIQMMCMKIFVKPPVVIPGLFVKCDRYLLSLILSALTMYVVFAHFGIGSSDGKSPITVTTTIESESEQDQTGLYNITLGIQSTNIPF